MAKGYRIQHIVKEVGSGVNDVRPKLINLLKKTKRLQHFACRT
ncbi:MAG: hypothetical protein QXD54_05625 [Candidatus Aenigmatarchaeota archaeon]